MTKIKLYKVAELTKFFIRMDLTEVLSALVVYASEPDAFDDE